MECKTAANESERRHIFRQRYRIFVETYKYLEPDNTLGRTESDPYDEYALLFGVWKGKKLIASCRLILPNEALGLPTLNCMQIDPSFSYPLAKTGEISRIIVIPKPISIRTSVKIFNLMQQEIYTESKKYGLEQWVGAIEPAFLRLLHHAKLNYTPIGPLQPHIGPNRFPVVLTVRDYLSTQQGGL